MTKQEQPHDMLHETSTRQTGTATAMASSSLREREETTPRCSAGIVSHRDQFSEPEFIDESEPVSDPGITDVLKKFKNSLTEREQARNRQTIRPTHCAPPRATLPKPMLQTVFLLSGYSIKPGSNGGVVFQGTTVFGKSIRISAREIKSIEPIPEFMDTHLERVSLRDEAVKLLVICENASYDVRIYACWNLYLQDVALPAIEDMIRRWAGASTSPGIVNPVSEFFFGRGGVLHDQMDRGEVVKRLDSMTSDPIVPLLTRYKGPAMVFAYEQ